MTLEIYLGNKNYSSWSLRPWLLLKHLGLPFTEVMLSVSGSDFNPQVKVFSGNGRVPCLYADGFAIWDSLAIAEWLAEQHPQLWPAAPQARARARSIVAEMHAGLSKLRSAMPMNLKLRLKGKVVAPDVQRDIDRVIEIWTEARTQFACGDGPWLFGDYSIADAFFAPVVCRFDSYNVPLPPLAAAYRDTVLADPALQEWRAAALQESEAHAHYDCIADDYGGAR